MNEQAIRANLIEAACAARQNAYAPYSHFKVGAALLGEDGQIYTGVNVENASFGLTNCAERTAIFTMLTSGAHGIRALAVCTKNAVAPCGSCRQVISEFVDHEDDIPIYLADTAGNVRETTLRALLPDPFHSAHF